MERLNKFFLGFLLLAVAVGGVLSPRAAHAWWNDDWTFRTKLTIDTGATGVPIADPIGTVAVLVRLHTGNFKFESAKEDGGDLRFVADDDKTPLKHHIEKFDSLLGEAFVWVKVPDLKPGAQANFYIYYGNSKAPSGDDAKGTYDPETVLVYHFTGRGQPERDFSSWGNNAQSAGLPASASLIGPGARFDGQSTIAIPATPSLLWTEAAPLTWSVWFNAAEFKANSILFSRQEATNAFKIGIDNGLPFVEVTNAAGIQRSLGTAPIAAASWHHLAVVAGSQIDVFLDGSLYATLNATVPVLNSPAMLGGDLLAPADGFIGELDELVIAKVARPAGFIMAASVGQGGALVTKFLAHGIDEEAAGWGTGYLTVILKSVTFDGWVVIGILLVMAIISWFVMVEKSLYVRNQVRANKKFLEAFHHVAGDLTLLDRMDRRELASMGGQVASAQQKNLKSSALYHIYHIGVEQIQMRFPDPRAPKLLSSQSIAAIRATLDGGLIRETQKLNRLMVLLTIAISGGPFLGLLGTVVGVMITFAAIAASGDVNVNAIAPGIAAALVATVAGLAVAIPALFGYNYITSQIKDVTSDMLVFVDEFVTRMAECYQGQSDQRSVAAE